LAGGGRRRVLIDVNGVFEPGRLSVVTGAVGAGKSTLLQILAGLLRPTAGEVLADGAPVSRWRADHRDRWRRDVGIVFQQAMLIEGLSVSENVMLPLVPRGLSIRTLRRAAATVLDRLQLGALAQREVASLSAGERQRVAVARALTTGSKTLVADEPTAHQDSQGADLVWRALGAAAATDVVVIVASHESHAPAAADGSRYWLHQGRLEMFP
jgi:ABC-type lipoprotein export system ATPase subunit